MKQSRWTGVFCLVLVAWFAVQANAQGTRADYERMGQLGSMTTGKVFRTEVVPNWLQDESAFWYRINTAAKTSEYVFVDTRRGTREPAFDHQLVAESLGKLTSTKLETGNLPFLNLQFADDGSVVLVDYANAQWKIRRSDSTVSKATEQDVVNTVASVVTSLKHSTDGGSAVDVQFHNDSTKEIQLIWIDRGGRRVPYETIAPGGIVTQGTFVGHVWLIVDGEDNPLATYTVDANHPSFRVDDNSKLSIAPAPQRRRSRGPRPNADSPDDRFRAVVRDYQLVLRESESNQERDLTDDASENNYFDERSIWWSPDSRYLVALQVQPGEQRQVYTIESSPRDQLQPRLHQMTYPKPGDRLEIRLPRIFDVASGKEVPFDQSVIANAWSLGDFRWRENSSEFSFLYNQRGHQKLQIIGIQPENGSARVIVDESVATFVDYTNKVYSSYNESADEIVWMSERDGWNHLYLYDWSDGQVKNQITRGQWVVRDIDRVDHEKRQVWFQASGIVPEQDPYYVHFCRIDLDGSNLVVMTDGDGTHSVEYSPDGNFLIDRFSRVDMPPVTTLRCVDDGSLVCELEAGNWEPLLETGWQKPIRFDAKGRDGVTDIFGVIYKPANFDSAKTYPVIEYIYAGPHDSFVPKRFSVHNQMREMAELGFIVVQTDGMGTSNRSKAFHDVCWQNLGDSGFPDRILWLKAAAEQFPQMDLERVGIYGGSAGGQSALRGLLAHPEIYKVAVSDCGCHDNRMDKIWWNEQWMGWPIGPHYEEQSNVTNAHLLQGQLLLIVGELDRNVDPASTMQVVDALIRADKDFDLLVVPGAGHGIGSGRYGMRRTQDFFVRHLLGVQPRSE